ncbi:hypothetical protein KAFR_0C04190 [Kazachstania africana CBS 2517]|uniref:3-ketodihydrosphingosine reductase TSC10 n=1 Tax=Kazachstania africana (strain ATCC 22294 / BCRC 22015 / CBS 2517 / CECT 1963 / NBRC 1671 / NRRL Y-8276) TaxID=1071382 RepID=H2ASR0_KAZAF|nr:hypothetical protein KAFR_0C04190 [Kazachstania africana CBS 2517]CCF57410.1 hypothetical protein KAFR_0C04190 [Kazachstania africana CBS 2517]
MKYTLEDQTVLITGGSQGLGKQFAIKYYQESRNSKIIIVSRAASKLSKVIQEITKQEDAIELSEKTTQSVISANRIFYIPCDISIYASVSGMFEILQSINLLPTQILQCAGGSTPKLFKDLTSEELSGGVQMNYLTSLNIAHHAAKLLTSKKIHLIFFSSATAFFPFIGYSQYAPLKASLRALVSILRQELPNFRISCVYPGNFDSEGFKIEELTKPEITKEIEGPSYPISCEECCDKIIWWLEKGYDDVTTDTIGWILMSIDLGLNKNVYGRSFLYILQLILGALINLIIVPFYMLFCSYQIKSWFNKQEKKQ